MSLRQGTDSADTESVENDGVVLISFDLEKNLSLDDSLGNCRARVEKRGDQFSRTSQSALQKNNRIDVHNLANIIRMYISALSFSLIFELLLKTEF